MNQLTFEMEDNERHLISLKERLVRIDGADQTIGFDGEKVWVAPDSAEAANARFYHNLYFYFFAMPFVLGDPGVRYEDLESRQLSGKTYDAVKVSFQSGVGDSPKDNYILYYDPETFQMEWLMYTVTYFDNQETNRYNLIKYDQWAEYEGLKLPAVLQWYEYQDDVVGEVRNQVRFENVVVTTNQPDIGAFEMPENARVAE